MTLNLEIKDTPIVKASTSTRGPVDFTLCLSFCQMNPTQLMDNGHVAEVTSLQIIPDTFKIWQIAPKLAASIPPDYHTFHVWLKLDENCRSSSLSKILTSEILQSTTTTPNHRESDMKSTSTYALTRDASSIFPPVQPFSRQCTFLDFPTGTHVKISKCHKFFNFWQIAKKCIT